MNSGPDRPTVVTAGEAPARGGVREPSRMAKPMPVSYRHIAGMSLERLTALSDGIFAVAMTLLVLGLATGQTMLSILPGRYGRLAR